MSTASDLIESIEAAGGNFRIVGDRLAVTPKEAAAPVLEQLREYKAAIIELLSQRPPLPRGVRFVQWQLRQAPVQLSECEVIVDVEKFVAVTLRRLNAELQGRHWLAGNHGLIGLLDRLAAAGCNVALRDPGRALQ